MATVQRRTWDRTETQRKIRHPLQALSGYIRSYVILEGVAVALIFLALCFWGWLLLDFGIFSVFAFDGVKWLDRTYSAETAWFIRAFFLGLVVVGLLALVAFKVVRRLFTEFKDTSLALVLERRFPKHLGDRLITAVELADPKLADKYGYSQEMVDHTIRSAAERVAQVPVKEVFNWKRLAKQWLLVAVCTVGIYLLVMGTFMGYLAAAEQSPTDFFWRFNRTSAIWGKRNVALMERVYWPTRAYVEFVRFQASEVNYDVELLKVPRDGERPMLEVRAFQWVIYDPSVADSIRPLRWSDLEDLVKKGWLDKSDLDIPLPASWPEWVMNINDLDVAVPAGLVPTAWNGKTSGQIGKALADPNLRKLLSKAGVLEHYEDWLNWKTWSIDQLQAQLEKPEVRKKLEDQSFAHHGPTMMGLTSSTHGQGALLAAAVANPGSVEQSVEKFTPLLKKINALIGEGGKLDQLSQSPSKNWDIRKLDPVPAQVHVHFSGKQTRSYSSFGRQEGNRFYVSLKDLKESVRLNLSAEDFFAPPRDIELVPPPEFSKLEVILEEPAYKYYHLKNGPQAPLKGEKQVSVGSLSVSGQITQFDVLKGTDVKLVATAERELKEGIQIEAPPTSRQKFKNSEKPVGPAVLDANNKKVFTLTIPSVQQTYEFELHYVDQHNVRGSRHIIIKVFEDESPEEAVKLALTFPLRVPTVIQSEEEGAQQVSGLKGYLITPDAKVPLKGMMKDDLGISNMEWEFEYEVIDFNLSDYLFKSHKLKEELEAQKLAKQALKAKLDSYRRAQLLAVGFHGLPLYPSQHLVAPLHLPMLSGKMIEISEAKSIKGELAPMLSFHAKLSGMDSKMWLAEDLKKHLRDVKGTAATFFSLKNSADKEAATKKLTAPKQPLPTSWRIEDEDGFDVQQWVGDFLKPKNKNSPQQHYKLLLRAKATDNNLESGPGTAFSKEPVIFIVISSTELQILIRQQENLISEALQEVKNKLDKEVRNTIGEQVGKIKGSDKQDLSLIRIRIEKDVLPFVIKTSDVVNKALTDYKKIHDEMLINRLDKTFSGHVKFKIIHPLEDLVEKKGDMERALAEVQKLHAKLKEQEDSYKGQSIAEVKDIHLGNLNKSQAELNKVVVALHEIIEQIGGGIPKDKLIHELEVIIELRKQHDATLASLHDQAEKELLKLLQGLGEPERPDPKKEIKKQ